MPQGRERPEQAALGETEPVTQEVDPLEAGLA